MALPLAAAAAEVNEVRRVPIAPGLLDANHRHDPGRGRTVQPTAYVDVGQGQP